MRFALKGLCLDCLPNQKLQASRIDSEIELKRTFWKSEDRKADCASLALMRSSIGSAIPSPLRSTLEFEVGGELDTPSGFRLDLRCVMDMLIRTFFVMSRIN